ncbi:MAG: tripartite tricarboxylate transporter substrate binding protein [Deltaproteobacteria bacterium]|nr:tripartite tricarboxylate transporter substrate binding protein [Deltaproteobacteria bacterium]
MKRWARIVLVFACVTACLLGSALVGRVGAAESDFPKKEITIICSFAPGGSRDILARGVAKFMPKYLGGVPMVVVNTPGAGGARGSIQLYHAAPDGYTVGFGTATEIMLEIVEKQAFENKKFAYIGRVQSSPTFCYVKGDSPIKSIKDLKAMSKSVRLSALGVTQSSTVPVIIIAKREGFPLTIISGFGSGPPALLSVIRGEVEMASFPLSPALPFLKTGQLRPILTIDRKRYADYPDVPTVGDIGHPDLGNFALDYWMIASPGVPKDRVKILEDALMKTVKDPEFVTWAKGAGVDPAWMGGEETLKGVNGLFGLLEAYKGDIEKYMKK